LPESPEISKLPGRGRLARLRGHGGYILIATGLASLTTVLVVVFLTGHVDLNALTKMLICLMALGLAVCSYVVWLMMHARRRGSRP